MHRLTAVGIALLAFAPDVHALLCANNNGRLAVREVCKDREHEVPIATLLPPPRATLFTETFGGAIPLSSPGTKVAVLTLPGAGDPSFIGPYAVFATARLVNEGAVTAGVSCQVIMNNGGIPNGLGVGRAGDTVDASGSTTLTLLGTVLDGAPGCIQNGCGKLALYCAGPPGSDFSATFASLLAVPVDHVEPRQPGL
jgi:hypothetical protein